MTQKEKLPDIEVLNALSPKEENGVLTSPKLDLYIQEYQPDEPILWRSFSAAQRGSLDERYVAGKLASFYQLKTAADLLGHQTTDLLWTNRFNQAAEELYGEVNPDEALDLIRQGLENITGQPDSYVQQVYMDVLGDRSSETKRSFKSETLEPLREALFSYYPDIVETVHELEEGPYTPARVREVFSAIFNKMAQEDSDWGEWEITNRPGKTMISVIAAKKIIDIPDGRQPVKDKEEILRLAMHEIGVHVKRAVSGYKLDDEMMATGVPEYIEFEEGLAAIYEYLSTGAIPYKMKDRYIDIALATGAIDGYRLSREELIRLGISREESRAITLGEPVNHEEISKDIQNRVSRIFRGGNGQPIRNETGEIITQPVFSKDLVYYKGFIEAYDFLVEKINSGYPLDKLLDYLMSGKFDPTNQLHTDYIEERHGISL